MIRFGVVAFTLVVALSPVTTSAQSLVGAWTLEQVEVTGNPTPGTYTGRTGQMVFTETHYSALYTILQDGRRPPLGDNATDAEELAAFTPFVAHTGTYTLDGSTLTERRVLDKVPDNDTATSTSQVRFDGPDTVYLTLSPLGNPAVTVTQKWVRAATGDEAAVNARVDALFDSVRAGDAEANASFYHENGVLAFGPDVTVGRANILRRFREGVATRGGGVPITFTRHGTTLVPPTAAVMHGMTDTEGGDRGHVMFSLVKEGEEWFVAAFQSAPVQVDSALQQAVEARNAARETRDSETWGSYTTDDFVVIGGDGMSTKPERMAAIDAGQNTGPAPERETDIRTYGDTAIVTGAGPDSHVTTVWVRVNARWLAAHVQFTPVSAP